MSRPGTTDLSTLTDIYSAWIDFAAKHNGEKSALKELSPENQKIVQMVVGILEHNKKALTRTGRSEPLILTKAESIALRGLTADKVFGATHAAHLENQDILGRIHQSFEAIHAVGRGQKTLEKYHRADHLTGSPEYDQTLRAKLETALQKILDRPPGKRQGDEGRAILEEKEVILGAFREWAKELKSPKDQRVALAAVDSLEKTMRPAHYGLTGEDVREAMTQFTLELDLQIAKSYGKGDAATLAKTGLSTEGKSMLRAVGIGFKEAQGLVKELEKERGSIGAEFIGRITGHGVGKESVDHYLERAEDIANAFSYLEAELKPYLANRDVEALYGQVVLAHVEFLRSHLQSAHEIRDAYQKLTTEGFIDEARRLAEHASSPEMAIRELMQDHPSEEVQRIQAEADSLEKQAFLWIRHAADLGDGPSAVQAARLSMRYAPLEGFDRDYYQRDVEGFLETATKQKAPGVQMVKGDYLLRNFEEARAIRPSATSTRFTEAQWRQMNIYSDLAIKAYQKAGAEGIYGLNDLFSKGVLEAGEAMVPLLKQLVNRKNPNPRHIEMLQVLSVAEVEGAEKVLKGIHQETHPTTPAIQAKALQALQAAHDGLRRSPQGLKPEEESAMAAALSHLAPSSRTKDEEVESLLGPADRGSLRAVSRSGSESSLLVVPGDEAPKQPNPLTRFRNFLMSRWLPEDALAAPSWTSYLSLSAFWQRLGIGKGSIVASSRADVIDLPPLRDRKPPSPPVTSDSVTGAGERIPIVRKPREFNPKEVGKVVRELEKGKFFAANNTSFLTFAKVYGRGEFLSKDPGQFWRRRVQSELEGQGKNLTDLMNILAPLGDVRGKEAELAPKFAKALFGKEGDNEINAAGVLLENLHLLHLP